MSLRTLTRASALALALCVPLAGCGKLGDLQRPGPLNGQGRATTKAADEVDRKTQNASHPVDNIDPRDRTTDPAPPRTLPIEGSGSDPTAQPPPGVLPNPYASPRP